MDREKSRQFNVDRVRHLAVAAHESIKTIQDEIAGSPDSMDIYWRIRAAADLALAAATQFQVVGEASSFYLDWTVDFDQEHYEIAYSSIQSALERTTDLWQPTRAVQNSLSFMENVGYPRIPNFRPERWLDEQESLKVVWLRASRAFRGYRATSDGWRKYFDGERIFAAGRYDEAKHHFKNAATQFETGMNHLQTALHRNLQWYDHRAKELECRGPYEVEAMQLYASAARAFANDETSIGEKLLKKGAAKRQEAADSC